MITEEIEKQHTGFWGREDCEDRSEMAVEKFPEFFNDPNHVAKYEQVLSIVDSFFPAKKGIYVNHRVGTSKSGPFTAIKVDDPIFPNNLPRALKQKLYYEPLETLGIKIVYNKATNGYIFHVR